ncbi:DUF4267 domain-containing protein [Streptomyces sp. NPDC002855]|uniref:DUF4267 domain-containing protein n=1 Tax=Streptomyces sp. NPDC002855 TaxID=3154437 RepID=UPI00332A5C9F
MNTKHIATGLAVLGGAFIAYIGACYLLDPQATASGFGLPSWPRREQDGTGFLAVKGVRDLGLALVVFALLFTGQRRALGWAFLAMAFVPAGDMAIVLSSGGSAATALGVHGATAVAVAVTAVLLLRERATGQPQGVRPTDRNRSSRVS